MVYEYKDPETSARFRGCHLCLAILPDDWEHWHNRFDERTKLSCTGCNHALPPLQRDAPNPMSGVFRKDCRRCGATKPNDFEHFGRILWRRRDEFTTASICLECRAAKAASTRAANRGPGTGL